MADQELYEVETLLDKKVEKKHVYYLVRWRNFSQEYDTWEPAGNLRACQLLFQNFTKRKKNLKSTSVAAKLLKKSKVANMKGPASKLNISTAKKVNQLAVRQKIAAELKSKAKQLAKLEAVVKDKKTQKKGKDVKKTVPKPDNALTIGGNMVSPRSEPSGDNTPKSVVATVKKKVKEQIETVSEGICDSEFAGTKRALETLAVGKKEHSVKKKKMQEASDSPQSNGKKKQESLDTPQRNGKKKQETSGTAQSSGKKKQETSETPQSSGKKKQGTLDTPHSNKNASEKKKKKVSQVPIDNKTVTNTESKEGSSKSTSKTSMKKSQSSKLKCDLNSGIVNSSKASTKSSGNTGKQEKSSAKPTKTETQSTPSTYVDNFSIVSDSESDDDDVLYSLSDSVDAKAGWEETTKTAAKAQSEGCVADKASASNGGKVSPKKHSVNSPLSKSPGSASKRMSLMDFKKPKSSKQKPGALDQLLRPSSPTPFFTPLKAAQSPLLGALPTTSTLTMDSLVGDVPSFQAAPAGPLSPSSISYKSLLDSLPSQLHPKGKKKKDNGNGASSGSSGQSVASSCAVASEPIERRTSVRAVECAFRYKQIVVKKLPRYTQIWLNTQTVMKNAFNPQVVQEVVAALNTAKYDDSSLVLFSGIGNFFCSGIDLHFLTTGDVRVAARQMADALRELTKAFITFPKPVIAAVGGSAAGLGVALLCLCDVVYASDKAAFNLPYAQLSQTPEGCSSFTLPSNIGLAAASELLFGGRRITAMEAYQLGLVSHVFWPTAFMQEVIPRAQSMANCSPKVLEGTKLLVRSHHRTKMELTNETECNLLLERWASSDCQRAMEAYLANENNFSS